jgi:hypothetical protein
MTIASDIAPPWPDAIVDLGPIELCENHWGVVGRIPYDGHVVLAVCRTAPTSRATSS